VSNLALRLLVASLGIPLLLWCAISGGYWLIGLVAAIQIALLSEWNNISLKQGVTLWPLSVALAVVGIDLFVFADGASWRVGVVLLAIYVWILLSVFNFARKPLQQLGYGALFLLYAALPIALWVPLSENSDMVRHSGMGALALLFAATWLCDSAAYFGGRTFGKHKLYPAASPNKTVEGAVSGVIGATVLLPILRVTGLAEPLPLDYVALPLVVGIAGQLGDLVESLIKREAGLKDSSQIIPGHGGVLDRFDSLLLSSPIFLAYLLLS